MKSPSDLTGGGNLFPPRRSLLDQIPFLAEKPTLTTAQMAVDDMVSGFLSQATDWRSMAALLAGGFAYRAGRLATLTAGQRWIQKGIFAGRLVQGASYGMGFAAESAVFAGVSREIGRWEGLSLRHSFENNWAHAAITLGPLKVFPFLFRENNLILQHLVTDLGLVGGTNLAHQFGVGEKPEGNLLAQLLRAEAMNWQMKGSMGLLHSFSPQLLPAERPLDLNIRLKDGEMSVGSNPFSPFPSRAHALAGGEGFKNPENEKPWTTFSLQSSAVEGFGGGTKSEAELIPQVVKALEKWKEDPYTPIDYGRFFLDVETLAGKPVTENQRQKIFGWWEQTLTENGKVAFSAESYGRNDGEKLIRQVYVGPHFQKQTYVLARQFGRVFFLHSDDKGNMSDFFLCGRGNCSARAKYILSIASGLKIPLPPGLRWTVQNYQNHLETVLYDESAQQIWVMSSGQLRIVDKIEVSLYDPAIFLHAFLRRKGVPSPVSFDDLLILKVPEPPHVTPWDPPPGENLFEFPTTKAHFQGGVTFRGHTVIFPEPNLPLRGAGLLILLGLASFLSLPKEREEKKSDPISKKQSSPDPSEKKGPLPETKVEVVGNNLWDTFNLDLSEYPFKQPSKILDLTGFYISKDRRMYVQDPADKSELKKLSEFEDQYDFFVGVARRKETDPRFLESLPFLSNPVETVRKYDPKQLRNISFFTNGIEEAHKDADHLLQGRLLGKPFEFEKKEVRLVEDLKSSSPSWRSFYSHLEGWKKWIHDRPEEFLKLLNEVPLEKKSALLDLAGGSGPPRPNPNLDPLRRLFYDQGVSLSTGEKEETPFDPSRGPQPVPEVWIEIDLESSAPTNNNAAPLKRERVKSDIFISPETALFFAMNVHRTSFDLSNLDNNTFSLRHWDPVLTQAFLQLNRKGNYDGRFIQNALWHTRSGPGGAVPFVRTHEWMKSQVSPSVWPILEEIHRRMPNYMNELFPMPPLPSGEASKDFKLTDESRHDGSK